MHSTPGRLTGAGIRRLPQERVAGMLARLKVQQGKGFRVAGVRYRVAGFRDPDSGDWVSRDPRNGQYYAVHGSARGARKAAGQAARHRTQVRPTAELLSRSNMLSLEVEVDRGKGPRVYHVSVPR